MPIVVCVMNEKQLYLRNIHFKFQNEIDLNRLKIYTY